MKSSIHLISVSKNHIHALNMEANIILSNTRSYSTVFVPALHNMSGLLWIIALGLFLLYVFTFEMLVPASTSFKWKFSFVASRSIH